MTPADLALAAASTDEAARSAASDFLGEHYGDAGQLRNDVIPAWVVANYKPRSRRRKKLAPDRIRGCIRWWYSGDDRKGLPMGTVTLMGFDALAADLILSPDNPAKVIMKTGERVADRIHGVYLATSINLPVVRLFWLPEPEPVAAEDF